MKLNLAGDNSTYYKEVAYDHGVPWVMSSYFYHKHSPTPGSGGRWKLDYRSEDSCKGLIMDSGAFSYISSREKREQSGSVDWWEYGGQYAEYVRDNDIDRWIGLDLDSIIGHDEVLELREYIEDLAGKPCIPVWHRNRGKQAWFDMCNEYDRVAMGGFPWDEIPPEKYHVLPWFINEAHKRDARVHGLGFQPTTDVLEMYPFDSTDSANWMWNGVYGTLYKWDGRRMHEHEHDKKVTNDLMEHNIREWAKYARYMDGKNEVELASGEW